MLSTKDTNDDFNYSSEEELKEIISCESKMRNNKYLESRNKTPSKANSSKARASSVTGEKRKWSEVANEDEVSVPCQTN